MPEHVTPMLAGLASASRATRTAGRTSSSGTACGRSPTASRAGCASRAARSASHLAVPGAPRRSPRSSARARRCSTARSSPSTRRAAQLPAAPAPHARRLRDAAVRRRMADVPATYIAFDLLYLDGRSLLDTALHRTPRAAARSSSSTGPTWQTPGAPPRRRRGAPASSPRREGSRGLSPSGSTSRTWPGVAAGPGSRSRTSARRSWSSAAGCGAGTAGRNARRAPRRLSRRRGGRAALRRPGRHGFTDDAELGRLSAALERCRPPEPVRGPPAAEGVHLRRARARGRGGVPRVDARAGTLRAPSFKGLRDDIDAERCSGPRPRRVRREWRA